MPANDLYYWYEFTDKGFYSYETPLKTHETGTFRVQGNRITLTTSTGDAVTRFFSFKCVGGRVMLDLDGRQFWSNPPRRCSSD